MPDDNPFRLDHDPLLPPFAMAAGCRVVGRDPSVLDFVLRWWPAPAVGTVAAGADPRLKDADGLDSLPRR